jgi:glucose/arabinose dehydrogenase
MRVVLGFVLLTAGLVAQPPVNSRPFRLDELKTQPGFEASVYAQTGAGIRLMTFGPNGVLYAAGSDAVFAVPEQGRGVRVLSGLAGAHSVAFKGSDLYIGAGDGVYRVRDAVTDDLAARNTPERIISLPAGGGHSTRTMAFGPDGAIYVTAGSTCNFCVETDSRRAAIMRFEADGTGQTIYASGLRNSVDFAWHPVSGDLWANDNGGDGLGDDVPPDEVNIIRAGGDYGWPDCYSQQRPVNWGSGARTERCGETIGPEVEIQAHSAPLGLSFYTGAQFPASWIGDALVGLHGSWNRNEPSGYKVVRVHASGGRNEGVEDFLWGFLDSGTRTRSGRPVHALNGPDGAVYVSDDATGNIYRVSYIGPRINPGGIVRRAAGVYELYGSNLAGSDPARFSIAADGVALSTLYVGAGQVNFVLRDGAAGDVTITVTNDRASDRATLHVE